MSNQSSLIELPLQRLETYLREERYHAHSSSWYITVARRFLRYLEKRKIVVEAAQPAQVRSYLQMELAAYRRRHGHPPPSVMQWRRKYTGAIHHLLRLAQGQWPPAVPPANVQEAFQRQVCDAYVQWLAQARNLASATRENRRDRAEEFLRWLGERGMPESLKHLTIRDVDAYLAWRCPRLRRTTRKQITLCLRGFLHYLYAHGLLLQDLAPAVTHPTLYAYEGIPAALRADEVRTVLEATRKDTTPIGRRDYAILLLLSTYGLRAGEVVRLRLEDVDWRRERIRLHHTKTGAQSFLPLLEPVGNALLDYLRQGRPQTQVREIFLRARAPYRPFVSGSSLYTPITRRLAAAGLAFQGKHGPHAFRHACATSLLKATVPMKTIGDILGHRRTDSTAVYLKLATEDLRAVGLDVPGEVTP